MGLYVSKYELGEIGVYGLDLCLLLLVLFLTRFPHSRPLVLIYETKRKQTIYETKHFEDLVAIAIAMHFSTTALVSAILPTLSLAHICAHHALQLEPQLPAVETQEQIPTYEAPQLNPNVQNHVHILTETITRTTQATTTLTSTSLPPLLLPSSISIYPTSSPTSTSPESIAFHEDLKMKRDETPTPTGTQKPLFTGHGPVQPGATFDAKGQNVTMLSGTLVKGTASVAGSKTASANASKKTSSSGAGVVGAEMGSFGLLGAVMVLVGLM